MSLPARALQVLADVKRELLSGDGEEPAEEKEEEKSSLQVRKREEEKRWGRQRMRRAKVRSGAWQNYKRSGGW